MTVRRGAALAVAALLALATSCRDDGDERTGSEGAGSTSSTAVTTTAAPPAAGLTDASPLRVDGIGPVRIGMTPAEAAAALGRSVTIDPDSVFGEESTALCGYTRTGGGPKDLSFMVTRARQSDPWRINRIDVHTESPIATEAGVRIGATEAEVREVYGKGPGKLGTEDHEYLLGGHYLTYDVDGPGGLLLLFETDGTRVTEFRAGRQEEVGYVEGCA